MSSESLESIWRDCITQTTKNNSTEIRENIGYRLDLYWRQNRANYHVLPEIRDTFSHKHLPESSSIYNQGPVILDKQQPSLVEAITETVRRLEFMEMLTNNQPNSIQAILMGGSLSYGRFINIRGNYPKSSDLDLIIINNSIPTKSDVLKILPVEIGFTSSDQEHFSQRLIHFHRLKRNKQAQMISHKFCLPPIGFDVSMHFMDCQTFSDICHPKMKENLPHHLFDYKANPFPHSKMHQRDIAGNEVILQSSETPTKMGVITKLPVYSFGNKYFIPGIYHNLISPMFELFFGDQETENNIFDLYQFLSKAIQTANLNKPDIGLSHPRQPLFSSYIISEINEKI